MINQIFKNSNELEFKVLELERIDENHKKYYKVRFVNSGYIASNVRSDTIKKGNLRDKLQPSLFGIGEIGYANANEDKKKYKLWRNMISRCYYPSDKSYMYYGEKGVTVCERWFRFDCFLEDLTNIENYNEQLFQEGKIFLDKDIKSNGNEKQYSLDNCIFVSQIENQKQRTKEYNEDHIKMVIFPDGHEEEIQNLSEFCKEHNLHRQNAQGCLNNKQKQTKGYKFYYKTNSE